MINLTNNILNFTLNTIIKIILKHNNKLNSQDTVVFRTVFNFKNLKKEIVKNTKLVTKETRV